MKLGKKQTEQARSEVVNTRRRSFQAAKKAADWTAVCLIGTEQPVPERFGSNSGRWPVRIAISKEPKKLVGQIDREQPLHGMVLLEHVWVETEAHGTRLKAALDGMLAGRSDDSRLRKSWKDLGEDSHPRDVWPILLGDALADIYLYGEEITIWNESQRNEQIVRESRLPKWKRS
jgi:hypothetical protein